MAKNRNMPRNRKATIETPLSQAGTTGKTARTQAHHLPPDMAASGVADVSLTEKKQQTSPKGDPTRRKSECSQVNPTTQDEKTRATYGHGLFGGLQDVNLVDATAPDLRRGPDNTWALRQLLVQGFSVAVLRNLWRDIAIARERTTNKTEQDASSKQR